ncbi:MAG TPA: tRNA epoxyqueuosine(34) reductase QueG, partial [Chloroflexota bacterium]|nr:tRNA epoxyqueuosine(34) reductase QueG [Chloroflexota bacterium]
PRGRIARYALGDDYHDVLLSRVRQLLDAVSSSLGTRPAGRFFVDSSPLSERAVAARAGLGWFGKNSCLLTSRGSWMLLAEIVTDLELQPDEPVRRDCGRCRICLDRCPTGALVGPYRLDARRCISYLTIEHRGAIPADLRPLIGDRIFGCDVCQEVCPHNRLARPCDEQAFAPRAGVGASPALLPLMSMDGARFKAMFRGSPVLRTKRRGLLRNVAVALGNSGDPAAVPALSAGLGDPEPLVRGHAAWALGRIGGIQARSALERALAAEADDEVRREIIAALA